MRAWTSAWIDPGRLDCAASPALRRSCSRKSGLPSARSTQLATSAAGIDDAWVASRLASSAFRGPRSRPISGAPWSTVRQAAGRRIAGKARRHDQQQGLPGGEQSQRGQALERPGVGPVDVLDQQEQGRRGRGRRRQLAHGVQRPLLAGRGAHRRGESAKRGRRRHVEQVIEEQLAVGGDRPGRGGAFDRGPARRSASIVPATPSRLRARLRIASRPVSAPKSSTAAAWQEKPSVRAWAANSATSRDLPTPGSPRTTMTRLRCRSAQAAAMAAKSRSSSSRPTSGPTPAAGAARSPRIRYGETGRSLPLTSTGALRVRLEMVGHLLPGVGADEHLAGPGQAAQAGGGVHGVAGQGVGAGAGVAAPGDHQAGVDAGVHAEARPARRRIQVDDQPVDRGVQLERGRDRPPRVVAPRQRHAEERHDLVADELVDGAAVALDHRGRLGLDPAHDRLDLLRVDRLVQRGVAGQVGEHHRRVAALARIDGGRRGGRELEAAAVAESLAVLERCAATRTGGLEAGATGAAEPGPGRVVGVAAGAGHGRQDRPWKGRSSPHGTGAGKRRRPRFRLPVGLTPGLPGYFSRSIPDDLRVSPSRNTIIGFSAVGHLACGAKPHPPSGSSTQASDAR